MQFRPILEPKRDRPLLFRFHDFELNEAEFALTRNGVRIAVEPRALRVLIALVSNHGKLLSKATLLQTVWQNTFVEETTLTRSIALLRKALEDDTRAPRFIETVPTRGYRFIAPVDAIDPAQPQRTEPQPEAAAEPEPTTAELTQPASRKPLYYVAAAAAVLALTLASTVYVRHRNATRLNPRDTLVLTGFTNTSGDPAFDDALRQGLLVELEQSPIVRLAPEGQIRKTLGLMGLGTDTSITPALGPDLCQRIGGSVVLDGSISRLGSNYILGLRARRCSTGEELDAEQIQVPRKEGVLDALGQIATRFRTRLGETRTTLAELNTPLPEATTASLDALKTYSQALRVFNSSGSSAALPLFQRAIELDGQFAMAHAWLGRAYSNLGQNEAALRSTQAAYELRAHASDRERYLIDASYDTLVSGNLEKARATCEAWLQMYPRDPYPRSFLAGIIHPAYGNYTRGAEEAQATIDLDNDFVLGYRNAALNLIALNRLNDAEHILQQARNRKLFLPSFITDSYRIAWLRHDEAAMHRALEAAPNNPWLISYAAATFARHGKIAQARAMHAIAIGVASHATRPEMQAELTAVTALEEAFTGYPANAIRLAREAVLLAPTRDVTYTAGLALALSGQFAEADKAATTLHSTYPQDTLVRYKYVPAIRAAVALGQNKPGQALDLLREGSALEWGQPLHGTYLRGQAYLALNQPVQATAEFRRLLDHPALVLNDPMANLAELELARSYGRTGEISSAKSSYDAVLMRWKDADSDLPGLRQAREERARLL